MSDQRAIVIGTGFGGAVAACRLAQAGFRVKVLERGRRYDGETPGFPRGNPAEWLWRSCRGLVDVRALSEVQVVHAAGYGGGSLIYANVHLRAPAGVFDATWPDGYSRAALDPYYDLVAYMLDIAPIDRSPLGLPPKVERMRAAAAALGRSEQFIHPPLAINFAREAGLNKFGVMQGGCTHCGECVVGCTRRAKNTLDLNYLAVAERLGAQMLTECEVVEISPRANGSGGYRVRYRDHRDGVDRVEEAAQVFLCAGAINSTEILLRSRASGVLPGVSARLGEKYSGNGDLLAFAFDADPQVCPDDGPTITTALLYAADEEADRGWFVLEDGGFPRMLWPLVQHIESLPAGLAATAPPASHSEVSAGLRSAAERGIPSPPEQLVDDRAMERTGVFLAMGRDLADGRIELCEGGGLRLMWNVGTNLSLYSVEERLIRDMASRLKGTYRANPFWRFLRHPITVHGLGGCPMGRSETYGVVSAIGEVFNYPGLFVMDGSILPRATGVNPAHTIAAVAERNIESIIRRTLASPEWAPPERCKVTPFSDPLASATRVPTRPPETAAVGLTFHETMTGAWERSGAAGSGAVARCDLRITIDDVARFISDPAHVGVVTGTVTLAGLTGPGGVEVEGGVWNLFVESGRDGEREMRYTLPFHGPDGVLYALRGTKVFQPSPGLGLWAENTTLRFLVGLEEDARAPDTGSGVVTIGVTGVISLLASMRPLRAPNAGLARRSVLDFLAFYTKSLREASRPRVAG